MARQIYPIYVNPDDETIKGQVIWYQDEAEVGNELFDDAYTAEDYFADLPMDEFITRKELWGYDSFGDWELLDERDLSDKEETV